MSIIMATRLEDSDELARDVTGILGRRFHEGVQLVHVLEQDESRSYALNHALDTAAALRQHGVPAELVLLQGDPTTALTNYVRSAAASLLVVGEAGPEHPAGVIGFLRARELIARTSVPILRIGRANLLRNALVAHRPLRVLVALEDEADKNVRLLAALRHLRSAVPCETMFFGGPTAAMSRLAANVDVLHAKDRSGNFDLLLLDGDSYASLIDSGFQTSFLMVHGAVAAPVSRLD